MEAPELFPLSPPLPLPLPPLPCMPPPLDVHCGGPCPLPLHTVHCGPGWPLAPLPEPHRNAGCPQPSQLKHCMSLGSRPLPLPLPPLPKASRVSHEPASMPGGGGGAEWPNHGSRDSSQGSGPAAAEAHVDGGGLPLVTVTGCVAQPPHAPGHAEKASLRLRLALAAWSTPYTMASLFEEFPPPERRPRSLACLFSIQILTSG